MGWEGNNARRIYEYCQRGKTMITGKLEPSIKEVLTSQGQVKGIIHIYLYTIATANVGDSPNQESVDLIDSALQFQSQEGKDKP
jgi:hypothetical protein